MLKEKQERQEPEGRKVDQKERAIVQKAKYDESKKI